jgi:hypothetical protein
VYSLCLLLSNCITLVGSPVVRSTSAAMFLVCITCYGTTVRALQQEVLRSCQAPFSMFTTSTFRTYLHMSQTTATVQANLTGADGHYTTSEWQLLSLVAGLISRSKCNGPQNSRGAEASTDSSGSDGLTTNTPRYLLFSRPLALF